MRQGGSMPRLAALALACAALAAAPAPAAVPGQMNFQGLLLDAGGQPLTASVAIEFALFDAATGGAPLWSEAHAGVPVLNGVYDIALGSLAPIPESALAGGSLWLEIRPEGETLAPRQPLLAVPYAIRARDADDVGGLEAAYFSQVLQNFDWDGSGPPATDPREGTDDPDGDQLANFMDPDNDGDGLSDSAELAQGSDINLVTPRVTSVSPSKASAYRSTHLVVTGSNFEAGIALHVGGQIFAPQNLTPTRFEADLTPLGTPGPISLSAVNQSGESSAALQYLLLGRAVFVSPSGVGVGGLAGADATCNALAASAGLPGSYLAWLSDSAQSPSTRFAQTSEIYTLVDGTVVADGWSDLVDGSLDAPIRRRADGVLDSGTTVWTGTATDGTPTGTNCSNWTNSTISMSGLSGSAQATDALWTVAATRVCNATGRLYCFEQP